MRRSLVPSTPPRHLARKNTLLCFSPPETPLIWKAMLPERVVEQTGSWTWHDVYFILLYFYFFIQNDTRGKSGKRKKKKKEKKKLADCTVLRKHGSGKRRPSPSFSVFLCPGVLSASVGLEWALRASMANVPLYFPLPQHLLRVRASRYQGLV